MLHKCENVQEILLEMRARTKSYYENLCRSSTDPTNITPHWYQANHAEYSAMLRIHKKETMDYACISDAFKKIETAQKVP